MVRLSLARFLMCPDNIIVSLIVMYCLFTELINVIFNKTFQENVHVNDVVTDWLTFYMSPLPFSLVPYYYYSKIIICQPY